MKSNLKFTNTRCLSTKTSVKNDEMKLIEGGMTDVNAMKDIEACYINLLSKVVNFLQAQEESIEVLEIPFKVDTLESMKDLDSVPLDVKKFCSDVRIAQSSAFKRNLLEILLFPISKNVIVERKVLQLSKSELSRKNHLLYKELVQDDDVREAVLKYVNQIPELNKGIITTRMTLKSYKQEPLVHSLSLNVRNNNASSSYRYVYLGLFLESVLYEIIDNSRGNRSKASILNYLVDILSKNKPLSK